MEKEYKGKTGILVLTEAGIVIKQRGLGMMIGGLRGDKTVPYSSIVAIQLKRPGLTTGYIQFSLRGGSEAKGGLMDAIKDENTIAFYSGSFKDFEEAKRLIEERMAVSTGLVKQTSPMEELEKLAELRDKGIVTQEEFDLKKKNLLGL